MGRADLCSIPAPWFYASPSLFLLLRSLEHGEFGNPKRRHRHAELPKADAFVSLVLDPERCMALCVFCQEKKEPQLPSWFVLTPLSQRHIFTLQKHIFTIGPHVPLQYLCCAQHLFLCQRSDSMRYKAFRSSFPGRLPASNACQGQPYHGKNSPRLCGGWGATGGGNLLSWRLYGTEQGTDVAFNVYRHDKLNATPITTSTIIWTRRRGTIHLSDSRGSRKRPGQSAVSANGYLKSRSRTQA